VEADYGHSGGNPLALLQLHIGSCTKVTEQQSDGTDVCCCSGLSPAGGAAAHHISLYQRMTPFTLSRQPGHCADPGCLHFVLDYRMGIFISGYPIQSSISGFPDID